MRFDPTFSTGTIATIITIIGAASGVYTGVRTDTLQNKADIDTVKAVAVVERSTTSRDLSDLKIAVKELQASTNEIKESLAILRGRAATETGGRR